MFHLSNVEIKLDRDNEVYFSGETIHGTLNFCINEFVRIRSIDLLIDGNSSCSFFNGQKATDRVEGFEPYLKTYVYFLQRDISEHDLQPGDYSYKFELNLPKSLPSSFEHKAGNTSYSLTVVFSKSWSMDKKFKRDFVVINSNDFILPYLKPLTRFETKRFGCLSCKSEPVTASIQTNKEYFGIGEEVKFKVKISNFSSRDMKGLKVFLVQKSIFKPEKLTVNFIKKLSCVSNPVVVRRGSEFEWNDVSIKIPMVQPTYKGDLIEVTYLLLLECKTGAFARNVKVECELVIGIYTQLSEDRKEILFDIERLEKNPFKHLNKFRTFRTVA